MIDREEVERVIKEMKTQEELEHKLAEANDSKNSSRPYSDQKERKSTVLEEQS